MKVERFVEVAEHERHLLNMFLEREDQRDISPVERTVTWSFLTFQKMQRKIHALLLKLISATPVRNLSSMTRVLTVHM